MGWRCALLGIFVTIDTIDDWVSCGTIGALTIDALGPQKTQLNEWEEAIFTREVHL